MTSNVAYTWPIHTNCSILKLLFSFYRTYILNLLKDKWFHVNIQWFQHSEVRYSWIQMDWINKWLNKWMAVLDLVYLQHINEGVKGMTRFTSFFTVWSWILAGVWDRSHAETNSNPSFRKVVFPVWLFWCFSQFNYFWHAPLLILLHCIGLALESQVDFCLSYQAQQT